MVGQLSVSAEAILSQALLHGADSADAIVVRDRSVSVDVRNSELEHLERSDSTTIGLRVLAGRRQACVSASDSSPKTVERMARQAVAMAGEAPEDPYAGLAEAGQLATDLDLEALELCDRSEELPVESLFDRARRAEQAALAVSGVDAVSSSSAGHGFSTVDLAATNGFSGRVEQGYSACFCSAIAGTGLDMEVDHHGEMRIFDADMSEPEEIGRLAGERASERFGPSRPATGACPVIFDERVSSSLISHLLGAINGSAITRGASWLRDALDEAVLPAGLDIVEEPLRPRSLSSRPFDAEGLPRRRRCLVADGTLRSWVLDLATARKLGMESTGNASRNPASPPSPAVSNIAMTRGDLDRSQLAAEMGTGLIVTSMIGATINPTTGDYSRGASGLWVENGQVTGPVSGFTIAGNLRQMLKTLQPGNDVQPFRRFRVPSLLVEGLVVAGE